MSSAYLIPLLTCTFIASTIIIALLIAVLIEQYRLVRWYHVRYYTMPRLQHPGKRSRLYRWLVAIIIFPISKSVI